MCVDVCVGVCVGVCVYVCVRVCMYVCRYSVGVYIDSYGSSKNFVITLQKFRILYFNYAKLQMVKFTQAYRKG